jgi:hypothetical protein
MQRRNIVTTEICTNIMTGTLFYLPGTSLLDSGRAWPIQQREEYINGFFLSAFFLLHLEYC